MSKKTNPITKIAVFKGKKVRKVIFQNEWWFSVIDIVEALTETDRPRKYWNDLKMKVIKEGYRELSAKIGQLKLQSSDGKFYDTDCANTETIFRIIQTIPSPKAEPFKRWLAKVGYERPRKIIYLKGRIRNDTIASCLQFIRNEYCSILHSLTILGDCQVPQGEFFWTIHCAGTK